MADNPKTKNHLDPNQLPDRIYPNSPRFEDLSGKVFGLVSVLYPCGRNSDKRILYVSKCECGQFFQVSGRDLKNGNTKSCGCWHKQRATASNLERGGNLIGKRFGLLVVLEEVGFIKKADGRFSRIYKCQCDCGSICEVQHKYLTLGDTGSCGCLRSRGEADVFRLLRKQFGETYEIAREYSFPDLKMLAPLRFDFAVLRKGRPIFLVEYNGEQHYNPANGYYSENIVKSDRMKIEYCCKHNILLYIIKYSDDIKNSVRKIANEQL